jgi:nicotinamidase-related amidase
MSDQLAIDPGRSALLVMDLQNDLVSRGGVMTTTDEEALTRITAAIRATKAAMEAARAAGMAVIHVAVGRNAGEPPVNPHLPILQFLAKTDALVIGSEGFAFHPDVQPADGEPVIVKRSVSAFAGTELAPLLQGRGIDTLLLCGFATHMVVVGTARDAADRGYRVIVLSDCCTSGGLDRHEAALANIAMIGSVSDWQAFAAALAA